MTTQARLQLLVCVTLLWASSCSTGSETTEADDSGASEVIVIDSGQGDGSSSADGEGDGSTTTGPTIGATVQGECDEPEMSVGDTTASECLGTPPAELVVGSTTQAACEDEDRPFITPTEQSECTDEVAVGPVTIEPCEAVGEDLADEITLRPGPGRFTITHVNATFNCCGLVEMEAEMVEGVLIITENQVYDEEHGACHCNCEFTLGTEVTGLAGGVYTVRVVNGDTDEAYGDDLEVTVPNPASRFDARGGLGRIDLTHLNSSHNCCVDVAMRFSQAELDIKVWEIEAGEPCDCRCTFDLAASIRELPAGTYSVQLLDGEGGAAVGDPVEVAVAETEDTIEVDVYEDTLTIRHNNADWNCCGEIEMLVTVIGNRVRVEEKETYPDGDPCRCNCTYDLSVVASGFAPGTYTVEVFTMTESGEELFGTAEAVVPGAPSDSDGSESVSATVTADNTIEVTHSGAAYNCCSIVEMTATLDGADIAVQEVITNDELCRCTCDFELSTILSNLVPSTYSVTVTGADGTVVGTDTVDVGGELPTPPEEITFERSGTTISIHHGAAPYNCCSVVEMVLEADDAVLNVIETITNPDELCDCECVFDLDGSITGLDADTSYTAKLWRTSDDGERQLVDEENLASE